MTKKEILAKEFAADTCRDEMINHLVKVYAILAKITEELETQTKIRNEIVTALIQDAEKEKMDIA